jgi:hypothetical protein
LGFRVLTGQFSNVDHVCRCYAGTVLLLRFWKYLIPHEKLHILCRCSQIMGRNETDDLSAAQIFYPCMQCADIFFLKVWSLIHAMHPSHIFQLCWIEALSAASDSKWWCTSCSPLN